MHISILTRFYFSTSFEKSQISYQIGNEVIIKVDTKDRQWRQCVASYCRSSLTGLPSTIIQKTKWDYIFAAWMLLKLLFLTSFPILYQSGFTYWMKESKSRSRSNLKQRPCNTACWDVFTHDMSSSHLTPPHPQHDSSGRLEQEHQL